MKRIKKLVPFGKLIGLIVAFFTPIAKMESSQSCDVFGMSRSGTLIRTFKGSSMDLECELIILIENVLLSALILNFLSDFCKGQRWPVIF